MAAISSPVKWMPRRQPPSDRPTRKTGHDSHSFHCRRRADGAGFSGCLCAGHIGGIGGVRWWALSAACGFQGDVHRHRQFSADGGAVFHPGGRTDVGRRTDGRAAALCSPVRRPSAGRAGLCQCAVADTVLGHFRLRTGRCGRPGLHDGQDDGQGRLFACLCCGADIEHGHRGPDHSAVHQHDHLCHAG